MAGEHCFTGQAWLANSILAVCTLRGEVIFLQDGQQQSILRLETPLHCIDRCSTGFVVGGGDRSVRRFRWLPPEVRSAGLATPGCMGLVGACANHDQRT